MRAAEAGRIDQLERGDRHFLGVINLAERLDARLGHGGHRALRGMRERRIGLHAGKPFEERALAGTLVTDDADFHGGWGLGAGVWGLGSSKLCFEGALGSVERFAESFAQYIKLAFDSG